jgi:hypothetical protein
MSHDLLLGKPNLQAVLDGIVSGTTIEWPIMRMELLDLLKELQETEDELNIVRWRYNSLDP